MTAEHGKVRAVAKGVRKTKSRFGARLEPLSHVSLLLYQGAGARRREPGRDASTTSGPCATTSTGSPRASPCSRRSTSWPRSASRTPPLPDAARRAADAGDAADPPLVVPAFYWKLLAAEGLHPELDGCVTCGCREPFVAFDLDEGGVLCRTCRRGSRSAPRPRPALRRVLGGDLVPRCASRLGRHPRGRHPGRGGAGAPHRAAAPSCRHAGPGVTERRRYARWYCRRPGRA